jgi:hypothetical protein
MITLTVNIDPIITGVMEKFRAVLDDKAMVHDAIRAEAEAVVKKHLLALNSRSPNTGYYAKASAGANSRANVSRLHPTRIQTDGKGILIICLSPCHMRNCSRSASPNTNCRSTTRETQW